MNDNKTVLILIVEDEKPLREALKTKLRSEGFDVMEAANGEEGLEIINSKKPDLVLLDLMMPGIPGEQVLKEMNDSGLIKEIPVIVLSVKGNDTTIRNCIDQLGAVDYMSKSDYSLKEIVEKINKLLKI
ncbi:response regulator [bacterium]|jgi:DNA-binding response OmpR family regulator|nr:response regulator [bacterium]MBT4122269.1 response regulator [bacterium]MBT4335010.1 response regulator [bacterium]MBT4495447.1 response regulator [bacterium]MBT4763929.1 response regulator [bacterium]